MADTLTDYQRGARDALLDFADDLMERAATYAARGSADAKRAAAGGLRAVQITALQDNAYSLYALAAEARGAADVARRRAETPAQDPTHQVEEL